MADLWNDLRRELNAVGITLKIRLLGERFLLPLLVTSVLAYDQHTT